jgi:hypothetical protein
VSDYPPTKGLPFDAKLDTLSNYRLYHNPGLTSGTHNLVITATATNALWLDYAIAGTGTDTTSSVDSISSSPLAQISSSPLAQSTGGGGGSTSHSSKLNVAAIAGGTVGGVVFACLVLVILWILIRRSHHKRHDVDMDIIVPSHSAGTSATLGAYRLSNILSIRALGNSTGRLANIPRPPSIVGQSTNMPITPYRHDPNSNMGTSDPSLNPELGSHMTVANEALLVGNEMSTAVAGTSSAAMAPAPAFPPIAPFNPNTMIPDPDPPGPRQHKDSGVRMLVTQSMDTREEDVPPVYSPE